MAVDGFLNDIWDSVGKNRVVVVYSPLGQPIGVFQGESCKGTIPSDLPTMTRVNIDGKTLCVYRANIDYLRQELAEVKKEEGARDMAQKNDIFMKIASNSYAYSEYQKKDRSTNTEAFNRAKKALPEVMKLLPKKQRTYIYLYFVEQKSTVGIAKKYHINKATVSRTINRGLDRIYRITVIISPEFAE